MGSNHDAFVLRWSEFQCNVTTSFQSLRGEEDFFDVTLACDEDHQVKAHKVILAASSSFFRGLLKRNPGPNPILIMPPAVTFTELNHLIDFMYNGEVSIVQDEIDSFMTLAEMLKVKGLVEEKPETAKNQAPQPKMPKLPPGTNVNVRRRFSSDYPQPSPQHAKKPRMDKRGKSSAPRPSAAGAQLAPSSLPLAPHPTSSASMDEDDEINEIHEVSDPSGAAPGGNGAPAGVGPDSSSEGPEYMQEGYDESGNFAGTSGYVYH